MFDILLDSIPLLIISFITSIISATVGMAGGTTLLSLMIWVMPVQTAIPLHAAAQLMSNASRTWFLRKAVHYKLFIPFALGSVVGNAFAFFFISRFAWAHYFSLLISIIVLYSLFAPKNPKTFSIGQTGHFFLGSCIGFLGLFVGATGLLLGPFILGSKLNKESTVATQASMQTFNHALKIVSFLILGFQYLQHSNTLLTLLLGTFLGSMVGVNILKQLKSDFFFILFKLVLLLSSIKIIYDFVSQEI
jgi:uncharacterized membrane protein YfcA